MNLKFILPFFISIIFISCNSKTNQFDLKSLFKRWKVDYIELNGKRFDNLYGENGDFDYEFLKDNSYLIYSPSNESGNGNWELNNDENCIYIRNEKKEIYGKIISISEKNLVLIPATKIGKTQDKKVLVKYYYIPK